MRIEMDVAKDTGMWMDMAIQTNLKAVLDCNASTVAKLNSTGIDATWYSCLNITDLIR